jgi:hypothetical protein
VRNREKERKRERREGEGEGERIHGVRDNNREDPASSFILSSSHGNEPRLVRTIFILLRVVTSLFNHLFKPHHLSAILVAVSFKHTNLWGTCSATSTL